MKIAKSFLATVLLIGSFGVTNAPAAAPGVISNQDGVEKERIVGAASGEKISRTIDRYIHAALN